MADVAFLRSIPLLAEFEQDELDAIARGLKAQDYQPLQIIFEEGSPNRALHIVKEGRVRVTRRVDADDVILCDLVAGQTFGELSILEDGRATATLRAIPRTMILSLSMNDLASFLQSSPAAAAKFWRAIALDLRYRLLQTNDIVRTYFEVNRALVENPTFREAYAMCNR
ncbi:MAG TPA: cyclic nucleotide-binding domain-containing protein [Thermoanaerobaculia bacterium]